MRHRYDPVLHWQLLVGIISLRFAVAGQRQSVTDQFAVLHVVELCCLQGKQSTPLGRPLVTSVCAAESFIPAAAM